ncbi:hypothetical protein K8942_04230 [Candidatus Peribacteria bacterium]|nr:MAG: hypothetical protein K8942_04230 [Candidatus Peribacteria bacterium]
MVTAPTITAEGLDFVRAIQTTGRLLDKPNPVTINTLLDLLHEGETLAVLISKGKDPSKGIHLTQKSGLEFMEGQDANGFAFYAMPPQD